MYFFNTRTLGEVREVFHDETSARFEWTIPHCSELQRDYYYAPTVNYFNLNWFLQIYKNMNAVDAVYLHRESAPLGIQESFRLTIGYKTADGGDKHILPNETFPQDRNWYGRHIRQHLSKIASQGTVTLICTLWKEDSPPARGVSRETRTECATWSNGRKDEHVNPGFRGVPCGTQTEDTVFKGVSRETQTKDAHGRNDEHHSQAVSRGTQTEVTHDRNDGHHIRDISILSEQFKKLLLSGTGHDVLIQVKDKQFKAHKCVIQARSPVFAAMFSNEMVESAEGSVTIQDCDPDAFGQFLQFVYSGEVDISSVSSALGLYYSGDKYDIPRLKEISFEFLKNSFTTTTVFDVISLAARHEEEELLQQAIVYFAKNLEEVLLTVEWQRFLLDNPIQANEIYLKAAQCLKNSL